MSNEPLDPLYAAVFADSENGTPDNITQAGCLALARLGKEAWNAWRLKYPVTYPVDGHEDFPENIADFSNRPLSIGFEGFKFGDYADFSNTYFEDNSNFQNARFGWRTQFKKATFGSYNFFSGAEFKSNVSFEDAQFGDMTFFNSATFKDEANFRGAKFGDQADFSETEFGAGTQFINTQFGYYASFRKVKFGVECRKLQNIQTSFLGALFGINANFTETKFFGNVCFDGTQFRSDAKFERAEFYGNANFKGLNWESSFLSCTESEIKNTRNWSEKYGLKPDVFDSISFSGAEFHSTADFSNRSFIGRTSFARFSEVVTIFEYSPDGKQIEKNISHNYPVKFTKAPLFHNCKLHQDTTFDGAKYPKPSSDPTENDTAARAYRTLKLAFSQHQATREEQLFFRLEMAEEAARAPCTLKWLFWLYSHFSDYGYSLSRPMVLLFLTLPVFALIYNHLAGFTPCCLWTDSCQIKSELWQFTLMQALPLPGFDKWSESLRECLFLKHPSATLPIFVMLHKTIALLALFLSGLALRNLFKMK